jgi:hypothetical protein
MQDSKFKIRTTGTSGVFGYFAFCLSHFAFRAA